jgi:hypothetical protein
MSPPGHVRQSFPVSTSAERSDSSGEQSFLAEVWLSQGKPGRTKGSEGKRGKTKTLVDERRETKTTQC